MNGYKKTRYNLLLIGLHTVGAVWATALLGMQFQKDVDRSTEAIIMFALLVLVPMIHYAMIYAGQKKELVWTASVIALCVVDLTCLGLIWLMVTISFILESPLDYLTMLLSFDLLSLLYYLVTAWIGLRIYSTIVHFRRRKERLM